MSKTECKGRVIVNPDMQFQDDDICFLLFRLSTKRLADKIRNDTTGKYDFLFEDKSTPFAEKS